MRSPNPCRRCGRPVDHLLDHDEYTCMACRTWELAMLDRSSTVPIAIREGLELRGDTMAVNLWYPRLDGEPKYLQVGLYDVRAADDIRISYDFDRDGWVIEQAWTEDVEVPPSPEHKHGYIDSVEHWQEVGFVRAWALEREKGAMQDEEGTDGD